MFNRLQALLALVIGVSFGLSETALARDIASTSRLDVSAAAVDASPFNVGREPAKSWQVAQDVSEKEAFELAKDANSLRVWQAYLFKFPSGFRAEIAKAYIQKLKSGNSGGGQTGSDDTAITDDDNAADYIRASELAGSFRLAARNMSGVYINNTSAGLVTVRPNASDRRSGHWQFQQVSGTPFVRIRNRWKGTYLHIDRGTVQSHARSRRDPVTHWSLERARDGSNYAVLRNRATGAYLWTDEDDLFLYTSPGEPDAPRGHWQFLSMEDNDSYDEDDRDEPVTRPTTPRITCTNGYVKNGSCRCRSGRERVKLSRNRYRCNRVRTSCGKGMYYSKSRSKCVCKRGYEPGNGRCYRNEELDDNRGNTSCPRGFLLRKGFCVCPRGKKNIQGKCRRPKSSGGGTVRPQIRCSKIKFAFTRGKTCKCAGGRIFTGRACVLP